MEYDDGLIQTTPDALVIRRYNLLLQPKRIPYDQIRDVQKLTTGWVNGRGRLWGTTIPGTWLNLDFKRSGKRTAFKIRTDARVTPVVTPDDPDAFAAAMGDHAVDTAPRAD